MRILDCNYLCRSRPAMAVFTAFGTTCSGHLGLQTFHHVLTDPRTQNIPLILETPTFDNNRIVWGAEISVLNRLSGFGSKTGDGGDIDVDALMTELRSVVKSAEGRKGDGKAQTKVKKETRAGTKGKRKGNESEVDAEEEDGSMDDIDLGKNQV